MSIISLKYVTDRNTIGDHCKRLVGRRSPRIISLKPYFEGRTPGTVREIFSEDFLRLKKIGLENEI